MRGPLLQRCSARRDLFHRGCVVFRRAGEVWLRGVALRRKSANPGGLSMNCIAIALSITTAFAAGCGVTHLLRPAYAAENITAQVISTGDLEGTSCLPSTPAACATKCWSRRWRDHRDPGWQPAEASACQRQRDLVHPRRHRNDLARRQGSDGEAGRSRRHPQRHPAWRHQACRPHHQGDRDQDPAAGAG